jgi:glycosyltransferase involved in cell wall biosynthesis
MKILSIHNRYVIRGGEDESRDLEVQTLREHGHHVVDYVMDNRAIPSEHSLAVGLSSIWNSRSYKDVKALIKKEGVDAVKVDNYFPLVSPSVLYAAQEEGVPVVQSVRNFRYACPSAIFFRSGEPCESCAHRVLAWPGIFHGCYRSSRLQTAVIAAGICIHKLLSSWNRCVSVFVAASAATRDVMVRTGIPADRIFVKPNFIPDLGEGDGSGEFALYVGRLTEEKGIRVLLDAWAPFRNQIRLKIVGEGPLESVVRNCQRDNPQLEYLGRVPLREACALMGQAKVVIVPSRWYETFGRCIVEAYSKGTPVIASRLGAMKELVIHGRTGLHFEPGNVYDLRRQLDWMCHHLNEWRAMRQNARQEYLDKFTEEKNYRQMMEIFERAMGIHSMRVEQESNSGLSHGSRSD